MSNTPKKLRELRADEALCKFNCSTIINLKEGDGKKKHCGMCCPEAIEDRTKRVAPIHLGSQKKAEEKSKQRAKRLADAAEDKATRPGPKPS